MVFYKNLTWKAPELHKSLEDGKNDAKYNKKADIFSSAIVLWGICWKEVPTTFGIENIFESKVQHQKSYKIKSS